MQTVAVGTCLVLFHSFYILTASSFSVQFINKVQMYYSKRLFLMSESILMFTLAMQSTIAHWVHFTQLKKPFKNTNPAQFYGILNCTIFQSIRMVSLIVPPSVYSWPHKNRLHWSVSQCSCAVIVCWAVIFTSNVRDSILSQLLAGQTEVFTCLKRCSYKVTGRTWRRWARKGMINWGLWEPRL